MTNSAAHRDAMSALADRYFAEQCARLGPIDNVPAPQPRARAAAPRYRGARPVGLDRFRL